MVEQREGCQGGGGANGERKQLKREQCRVQAGREEEEGVATQRSLGSPWMALRWKRDQGIAGF